MDYSSFAKLNKGFEGVLAQVIQGFMTSMKQQGLSTPQIHALMYIFHAGECQVSDLGTLADVSKPAASQLVERLVRQGLVDRREDPANRRNKLLTLSEKGKQLIHNSVMSNQFLQDLLTALTPEQRQAVHNAFTLLAQTGRQIQKIHDTGGSQNE